jgi:hypothetical protein
LVTVTGNVAVEDEAEIFTEAGTVRAAPSLETATTTPPAGAGLVSVIVQALAEPALRVMGSHDSGVRVNGLRAKVTLAELFKRAVFKVAVIVTFWLVITTPAIATNVAEAAPPGTTTDGGIINSGLLVVNCTVRGLKSVLLNPTVQMLEPPVINDVGLQLREDTSGTTKIVPPVAVVGIAPPAAEVLNGLLTLMLAQDAAAAIVTVRTATTPFWMTFVFSSFWPSPVRKHV